MFEYLAPPGPLNLRIVVLAILGVILPVTLRFVTLWLISALCLGTDMFCGAVITQSAVKAFKESVKKDVKYFEQRQ
jgi:hypothetical protein